MCLTGTNQSNYQLPHIHLIYHRAATSSLIIMNLFSLIITACLIVTTVVADEKLKFYNVKSPMVDTIPSSNNKGTASFTVNSDGSVTIDIDWNEAAKAIVDGNDSKLYDEYMICIGYTSFSSNTHLCADIDL